jgi:hypothetical protein
VTHISPLSPSSSTGSPVRRFFLGAASALGLHTSTAMAPAALPAFPTTAPRDGVDDGELTAQLVRLHDDHVERANSAVAEGREDLLPEISDSYVGQAMALMTSAGFPPVGAAHQLTA